MKKITPHIIFKILFISLSLTQISYAQIIAWDMNGNAGNEATVTATAIAANMTATPLQRGLPVLGPAPINPSPLANAYSSTNFTNTNSFFTAFFNNESLTFTMKADCGYEISLSTIDVNFRRSNTGPDFFTWGYSIDDFNFVIGVGGVINYNSGNSNGMAQAQIDLSTIPELQNVSSTITLVLICASASNPLGTFAIGRLSGNDLAIGGTVASGSTTWNGTVWNNGTPNINRQAIIDGNYNTATNGNISGCSLTVNSGANLIVGDNTFVEIENDVTVEGSIDVLTQGSFVQNQASGTFTGSGSSSVTKSTPVKQDWFFYNYWSSPVQGEIIGNTFFDVDGDRRFQFNASNYLDTDGDGIDDDNNDWQFASAGTTMVPGVGYATTSSRFGPYPSSRMAAFDGPLNTGTISTPIAFNPLSTDSWNLIGNPYPSALDFDIFHANNSTLVEGVAYYWSQATAPSNSAPGNQGSNFSQNDYATYTVGSGGAAGASGEVPTRFVPSGQGFFINGLANGNVTFTNAMRVANGSSNSLFFKQQTTKNSATKTQELTVKTLTAPSHLDLLQNDDFRLSDTETNVIELPNTTLGATNKIDENRLWLNLTTDNGVFNQILVAYVNGATNANDGTFYDAPRRINQNFNAILYSLIDGSNEKYAVQGKAIGALASSESIQLGFATTIQAETSYKFSVAQLEGAFLANNVIYLRDHLNGITHNLTQQDYSFTSDTGEFNDRFEIVFSENSTLSTNDVNLDNSTIAITQIGEDRFKFNTNTSSINSIAVYDITGKLINTIQFENGANTQNITLNTLKNALYIAKIQLNNGASIHKKFLKN